MWRNKFLRGNFATGVVSSRRSGWAACFDYSKWQASAGAGQQEATAEFSENSRPSQNQGFSGSQLPWPGG